MQIERFFEMPRVWTFQAPKLRKWVEEHLEGDVLNLYGGAIRLPRSVHNDLNHSLLQEGDLNRDACDLTQWLDSEARFDTVVFDPPYSDRQAVVSYGAKKQQRVSHAKDVAEFVLRPGGRVISLGWNSTGMGEGRGFQKEALLLINHGGNHNDTVILVERRS